MSLSKWLCCIGAEPQVTRKSFLWFRPILLCMGVNSSIEKIPEIDIKFPDILVYSSLLLVISGDLLQIFAFDVKKWFKFKLVITNGTIEASLTTSYAIMNDRLYICYTNTAKLYYVDIDEVNDSYKKIII